MEGIQGKGWRGYRAGGEGDTGHGWRGYRARGG